MTPAAAPIDIPVRADFTASHLARRCAELAAQTLRLEADNARLQRENVVLGDRNVLLATELGAIVERAEMELGEWVTVTYPYLPPRLSAMKEIYDVAVEALAGPVLLTAEPPQEPGQGIAYLSGSAANAASARGS